MSHFISRENQQEMRDSIFEQEVWPRLTVGTRLKLWWSGRDSRKEVRAAFIMAVKSWDEEDSEIEWKLRAQANAVDPFTLWVIGVVINLLWQWFIRRRDTQTLRIMRG